MTDKQLSRGKQIKSEIAFLEGIAEALPKNANSLFTFVECEQGSMKKPVEFRTGYNKRFQEFINNMIINLNKEFNEL